MWLIYKEEHEFAPEELKELFLSAGWSSGEYPELLVRAMRGYNYVISVRDEASGKLVALASAMDDGVMTAYVHYLLVLPAYRAHGIGARLVEEVKAHYKDYLKIVLVDSSTRYPGRESFYAQFGFKDAEGITMYFTDMAD